MFALMGVRVRPGGYATQSGACSRYGASFAPVSFCPRVPSRNEARAACSLQTSPQGKPMTEPMAETSPAQKAGLPLWVQALPFVLLHLALVAVFLVPVTWPVLLLCAANYLWRM